MRLLIQHPHAEGEISGVLTSIREMLPGFAVHKSVEVRILSTKGASLRDLWKAATWSNAIMLNSNAIWLLLFGRILRRKTLLKLHYTQYQTVHWSYQPLGFGRRLHAEIRHLLGLESNISYIATSLARLVMRTAVALTVSRVCACSSFCAEQASLPRKVFVLKNALAVESRLSERRLGDLDRPYRFVFAGRIALDKGWDTLLDAAALLRSRGHEFSIDVAGDGPDLESMKARVVFSQLTEHIHLLGRLDTTQVKARLAGALAAVVPSRFQEPAGYVAVEAASVQVASIVSRVGGLPETAGAQCPTFDAGDAEQLRQQMEMFLTTPKQCLAVGRAAYLRAQTEFEPEAIAAQLLKLLDNNVLADARLIGQGLPTSTASGPD